jgi:hypothetical protein
MDHQDQVAVVSQTLKSHGLHAVLKMLNQRTSHRYTGVYRYDGEWLRNVALYDRWHPDLLTGDDAPMHETFCALVPGQGSSLEVQDGSIDERFPSMQANGVKYYSGTLLRDAAGQPYGTLCHFDLSPCDVATREFPLMEAVGPLIYEAVSDGARDPAR